MDMNPAAVERIRQARDLLGEALELIEQPSVTPTPIDPPPPPPAPSVDPARNVVAFEARPGVNPATVHVSWIVDPPAPIGLGFGDQDGFLGFAEVEPPRTAAVFDRVPRGSSRSDRPWPLGRPITVELLTAAGDGYVRTGRTVTVTLPVLSDTKPPVPGPSHAVPAGPWVRVEDVGARGKVRPVSEILGPGVELLTGPAGSELWIRGDADLSDFSSPFPVVHASGDLRLTNVEVNVSTAHHAGVISLQGAGALVLEQCTVRRSRIASSYGNGAVQTMAGNPVRLHRCDLSGFGDGFQGGGAVAITECFLHDNYVVPGPQGTHNDSAQVWGSLTMERCVSVLPAFPHPDHPTNVNAHVMLMDGASVTMRDCFLRGGAAGINRTKAGAQVLAITGVVDEGLRYGRVVP